jgi:hypothetical protein
MKLSTLNRAIENAIIDPIGVNSTEDFHELLTIRDEITRLADVCEDGFKTNVTLTSWYTFSNLMNEATYDDFGRLRKEAGPNNRILNRKYRDAVRFHVCEELTDTQIDDVADFLNDLWLDNEDNDCHNPDGTFKKSDENIETAILRNRIDELGTIINKLYHHRGLTADDVSTIEMYIH